MVTRRRQRRRGDGDHRDTPLGENVHILSGAEIVNSNLDGTIYVLVKSSSIRISVSNI